MLLVGLFLLAVVDVVVEEVFVSELSLADLASDLFVTGVLFVLVVMGDVQGGQIGSALLRGVLQLGEVQVTAFLLLVSE